MQIPPALPSREVFTSSNIQTSSRDSGLAEEIFLRAQQDGWVACVHRRGTRQPCTTGANRHQVRNRWRGWRCVRVADEIPGDAEVLLASDCKPFTLVLIV
jgi:hypothetical protein